MAFTVDDEGDGLDAVGVVGSGCCEYNSGRNRERMAAEVKHYPFVHHRSRRFHVILLLMIGYFSMAVKAFENKMLTSGYEEMSLSK
ncbi:hypothetical protein NECAME_07359 [Necator americanus]|uniref:Uncharacterized protein n=1 Tax=Necator americanus TaxID=51031 RepID=W2TR70_NECAM|nr:hypothetical protein NECAME_07359 [Necator americanus]ETN83537.1 hypothetical protein NECAME_07359 [Necator americanus]